MNIFTRCKGPCPLISTRMAELNGKLKKIHDGVKLASFTVDPEYDTPEVLSKYGANLGANPAVWKFLTGTPEATNEIIVKGLLQPIAKEPDGTPAHSQRFVIVDASKDENEGAANKMSLSLRFDRNNSDAFWQS